jgi:hypothetical protein
MIIIIILQKFCTHFWPTCFFTHYSPTWSSKRCLVKSRNYEVPQYATLSGLLSFPPSLSQNILLSTLFPNADINWRHIPGVTTTRLAHVTGAVHASCVQRTAWVQSFNTREKVGAKKQIMSKTWVPITAWPFHWRSLVLCFVHNKPKVRLTYSSNHTEHTENNSITSHAQHMTALQPNVLLTVNCPWRQGQLQTPQSVSLLYTHKKLTLNGVINFL